MHAFLIIGNNIEELKNRSEELAKRLHAKILEYPLIKIEDVRSLNNLIRLSFNEPTLIFSNDIHNATEEALNALLKNLEEPQDNIYFALTAPTTRKVLPTIISRCQTIKSTNLPITQSANKSVEEFLNLPVGEKLNYIDKIKDRNEAIELVENTVQILHSRLHENRVKYASVAADLEKATKTLSRLKANGNVGLQLTNFVINLL